MLWNRERFFGGDASDICRHGLFSSFWFSPPKYSAPPLHISAAERNGH
jgi:hypothetical protein